MKSPRIPIFLSIFILFLGCSDDNSVDDSLSGENELTSFVLKSESNNTVVNTEATINGTRVEIFLPSGSARNQLIPEFEISEKSTAYVDGVEVTSGSSTLDLTEAISLDIVAENGTSKQYTINLITDFPSLDVDIESMMRNFNIPGIQLAIVRNEKLVYTKSFGEADEENSELVTDASLFRIASVSKPITVIGIFKLADMGLLDLDDLVFGEGNILGTQYGTTPYAENVEQITVRHLLEHTSGWVNSPFDPMFANLSFSHSELISDILDNRPLATTPGAEYFYSNFGYCLLGRIIEEVSDLSYEDFMKENILGPSGITTMRVGGNLLADRFANEVKYYDQENFSAYNMNVTRMDANGGWIASATDLVKFLIHVDRNRNKEDIVSPEYLDELYFSFQNWLFYGSIPGTSAALSRVNDSFGYAIIANTRTIPITNILDQMNKVMRDEITSRSGWPSYDLLEVD